MAIRYNKQLNNEIYKAVRSFNAKVSRLEKKGVSAALLPDRISTKSIKANYQNKQSLRKHLQSLQEFTSRGQTFRSEGGVTGTTMLFQYNKKRANIAVKQLQRERRNLADIPTRYPMMKSEQIRLLESKMDYLKRDIMKLDIKQVNIFNKNIETTIKALEKNQIFHKNFNQMMFAVAYRNDLPKSKIARIEEKMNKLDANKLLELYRTVPAFQQVTEKYLARDNIVEDETETSEIYDALEAALDEALMAA